MLKDKIAKALGKDILELLDSNNNVSLSASSNNDHLQSHHAQTQTDFYHTQNYFYGNDALSAEVQHLAQHQNTRTTNITHSTKRRRKVPSCERYCRNLHKPNVQAA